LTYTNSPFFEIKSSNSFLIFLNNRLPHLWNSLTSIPTLSTFPAVFREEVSHLLLPPPLLPRSLSIHYRHLPCCSFSSPPVSLVSESLSFSPLSDLLKEDYTWYFPVFPVTPYPISTWLLFPTPSTFFWGSPVLPGWVQTLF
jgi:hypothetical protein